MKLRPFAFIILLCCLNLALADLGEIDKDTPLTDEEILLKAEALEFKAPETFQGVSEKSVINFYIPEREGFGDIASNLQMVDVLKKKYPGIRINVILNSFIHEKVAKLIAGYDLQRQIQKINGVVFFLDHIKEKPQADLFLSFSQHQKQKIGTLFPNLAPVNLQFTEFGDFKYELGKWGRHRRYTPELLTDEAKKSNTITLNSGAAEGGFYISKERPRVSMSAAEMVDAVRGLQKIKIEGAQIPVDHSTRIGFSYTIRETSSLNYIMAMSRKARQNPSEKFIAVVNGKNRTKLQVPTGIPNFQVLLVDSMPYELTKEVIGNSNMPILVTGDGSLNLAMEYEKPFFYESPYWKQESSRAVRETIAGTESFKGNRENIRLLAKTIPRAAAQGEQIVVPGADAMLEAMNSPEYLKSFQSALQTNRQNNVLTENMERLFKFLVKTKGRPTPEDFRKAFKEKSGNLTSCVHPLEVLNGLLSSF